ncbi:MAG: glycosyltransferase [Bacteroidota bacterium]
MGNTKFKVAYFQQDGSITGSAISLRHFLNVIDRNLFEPVVILAKEGPARELYESLDIKVMVFPFNTFWTFPGPGCFSRGMFRQLTALLPNKRLYQFITHQVQPDLVHINDKAALNVGISLKGSKIPIVQHSRSSYVITKCAIGKYLSKEAIKQYANYIISISEDEEDGFENFAHKSIIYNTVDLSLAEAARSKKRETRAALNVEDNEFLIGFAANVTEKKGAWDFLEICNKLKHLNNVKFIMVGEIAQSGQTYLSNGIVIQKTPLEYVKEYLKENNLQNKMMITGFRKDNLNLIAAMDVLVVPNKNGVLGRQPIEAQALGTTVVAQMGHSKKSNIILHEETGFCINNINEAIQRITSIIENNKHVAKKAIAHAEKNFNPSINIKAIENIYQKLLKS